MLCFICQTLLVSIVLAVVFVAHHRNYGYNGQQIDNERIIWVHLSLAIVMQFVNSKSMSNCNALQTTVSSMLVRMYVVIVGWVWRWHLANHLWPPINDLWLDLEGRDLHELTTHWNDAFEYVLDYLHPQAGLLTIVICFQIFQAYMENRKMEVSTSGWHTFHWKTCYNSSIPMYPQSQEPW